MDPSRLKSTKTKCKNWLEIPKDDSHSKDYWDRQFLPCMKIMVKDVMVGEVIKFLEGF